MRVSEVLEREGAMLLRLWRDSGSCNAVRRRGSVAGRCRESVKAKDRVVEINKRSTRNNNESEWGKRDQGDVVRATMKRSH